MNQRHVSSKVTTCSVTSYCLHQGGLGVGHQDKHISIQAELVDPTVQFSGHINPWATRRRSTAHLRVEQVVEVQTHGTNILNSKVFEKKKRCLFLSGSTHRGTEGPHGLVHQ